MNRNRNNIIVGVIFIVLGLVFAASALNIVNFSWNLIWSFFWNVIRMGWPLILLIIGLGMQLSFFSHKSSDSGILVPAGMFTTYGTLFLLCSFFGWQLMNYLWPLFILGVAIGLFELFLFGTKEKGLLIPVSILGGLSMIFLSSSMAGAVSGSVRPFIIPVILVIIGLVIVFRNAIFKHREF